MPRAGPCYQPCQPRPRVSFAPPHLEPIHPTSQAQAIAAAAPALLAVSTRLVAAKWARLCGATGARLEWQRALEAMTPATLAVQLTYSMDRFARLDYIAACGGGSGGGRGVAVGGSSGGDGPAGNEGGGRGRSSRASSGSSEGKTGSKQEVQWRPRGQQQQQQQQEEEVEAASAPEADSGAAAGSTPPLRQQRQRRLGENGRNGFTHLMGMTAAAFDARYPGFKAWAEARGLSRGSGSAAGASTARAKAGAAAAQEQPSSAGSG
jgi:hypothetical protein